MLPRHLALLLSVSLLPSASPAQGFEFLPGVEYDPAVPDLKAVVGHDFGEKITSHAEMVRYVQALAEASPRVQLVKYGETWEGRAMYYLVVGSPERLARIDVVKAGMQALASGPGLGQAGADQLIASLPAVVWLAYAVHGNEISGTDAALLTAYHLAAADADPLVQAAREECLVLIDPLENPDGRDRFVTYYRQTRGRWSDADAQSAEHNEFWPGGRTNHYLFDMNRDWFALTQPETAERVKAFLEWYPLVYVDLHEMGSNSSYYFPPPADPINPQFTEAQMKWLETFGRNNARWFDRMRFDYFTREVFDAFYPGYGEGWPSFHGAIGMTYEQASVRGLVVKRDDETEMTYRDSVQRHFVASLATIETAAREREALLRSFYAFRNDGAAGGTEPKTEYLLVPGRDPNRTAKLVGLLMAQGIEVKQATAAFRNDRVRELTAEGGAAMDLPAGTYVVPIAQPARRLLETLMARQQALSEEFVAEQERRRKKRLSTQFYDVTAWSLPLLYGVECLVAESESAGEFRVLTAPPERRGVAPERAAELAYVIPWGTNSAARALAAMFREKIRVFCADKSFVLGGVEFPAGSLIVKVKDNPADLHQRLSRIAERSGATITPTDTAWVEKGIGFGSNQVAFLKKPRVALAYGRPTSAYSVGWTRYLLERGYDYPVTILHARQIARSDLSKYDVLILPAARGGYGEVLDRGVDAIKAWIRGGGTLITLGDATRWLTGEKVGLLATKSEDKQKDKPKPGAAKPEDPDAKPGEDKSEEKPAPEPFDLEKAIQPDKEAPARTPGAIVRITVDTEHWLGFGYEAGANVLVGSSNIFTPVKLDKGRNVGVYEEADRLVVSGFTWAPAAKQLAQKAYLVHQPLGRGHIVAFAEDPNFRAFCDGLNLLFLNAVFFGPGH